MSYATVMYRILKKSLLQLSLIAAGMCLLQSCALYPSASLVTSQNVPMVTAMHEARLSVSTGTELYNIQGSFAATKHLAFMGGYSYGLGLSYTGQGSFDDINRNCWHLAAGYFLPETPHFSLETFGGIERYHRQYWATQNYSFTDSAKYNITKPFVQADLCFLNNGSDGLAFTIKFGMNYYDHSSFYHYDIRPGPTYPISTTFSKQAFGPFLTFEPAVTWRFGWQNFCFSLQAGINGYTPDNVGHNYEANGDYPFFANAGITIRLYQIGHYPFQTE